MFRCGGEKEAQDGTAAETKKISPTGNPDVWETLWGLFCLILVWCFENVLYYLEGKLYSTPWFMGNSKILNFTCHSDRRYAEKVGN